MDTILYTNPAQAAKRDGLWSSMLKSGAPKTIMSF